MNFLVGGEPGYLVPNMYLCIQLLNSALVGLAVMIILLPVPKTLAGLIGGAQKEKMRAVNIRTLRGCAVHSLILFTSRPMLACSWSPKVMLLTFPSEGDLRTHPPCAVLNVIRMIKLFGWDKRVEEDIKVKREEELKWVWKRTLYGFINMNIK